MLRSSFAARCVQFALCALLPMLAITQQSAAQVVRGVVRAGQSLLPIDLATVTATDSVGTVFGRTVSNGLGEFEVTINRPGTALVLHVKRLGFAEASTRLRALERADTVDVEFLMNEVAALGAAIVVSAEPSLNDQRLMMATRRGWKVFDPAEVAKHRGRASDFHQLLRSLGSPGLVLPRYSSDCIRTTRNNRCLTIVVDNQVLGTSAYVLPSDIYFMAILSASDSRIEYGDRAPFGAIAIYTRSHLDR